MSTPEVIMYYNPSCSKCLYALDFLKQQGIDPMLINYLSDTPSPSDIKSLLDKLGLSVHHVIRKSEPLFTEKFLDKIYTDEEWIVVLSKNPVLIQRPILVKNNEAVIGRTDDALRKISEE